MASRLVTMVTFLNILLLMLLGFASSDVNQDKEECANQIAALATCLPYVGGQAKTPTTDCCSGLKGLLEKSKKCLCLLIKDKDDPSLGLKINTTLAATLPSTCHSPANVSDCVSLLHLDPNSPDAKIFQGFANMTQGNNSTTVTSGSSSSENSDGGRSLLSPGRRWVGIEMACGVLLMIFFTFEHVISF